LAETETWNGTMSGFNLLSDRSSPPSSMPAELPPHCLERLAGERVFTARREALVERGGEHRGRHTLLDGGQHGPAPLAGVRHLGLHVRQLGVLGQRGGREVEQ